MSLDGEFEAEFQRAEGKIRLFPLPNYVPFPGIRQPLHLFEPRYVSLMDDLMESESSLLSLVVLRPGWKEIYNTKTCPIYPIGVVGMATNVERLENGRYNLLWEGMSRCRVLSEVAHAKEYRLGQLELVLDEMDAGLFGDVQVQSTMAWDLVEHFKSLRPDLASDSSFAKIVNEKMPLSQLCDLLAFLLKLDQELIYPFLAEPDIIKRGRNLAELMSLLRPTGAKFPPNFSDN